ncbi:MAG: acyl-CoA/acyl-ACP dehydrogenase, partial [Chloroflexi bacterium]|nr:acyl-CoA/acyl-ACP dehydrogenase [Chloroflexota bacterium]
MYRLNQEQQAIVDRAAEVAERDVKPRAAEVDEQARFPRESIEALGKAGLLGLSISPEYGGLGQGLRVASAVLDEIGQRCASTGMVYLMHLCGVACYNAVPDKTADQLRAAARGEHLSTLAWSERGSRSHFWAPVSQAAQSDGHFSLSAEKSFVTSAGQADGYVVSSQTPNAQGPMDTMLFLVDKGEQGFETAGAWTGLGMRGNASAPMTLRNVSVPAARALTEPSKGIDMMLGVVLPWFQLGNAAICIGVAEAATQATQGHISGASFQNLGGSKLADLPNERERLARMRIETDKARAHLVATLDAVESASATAQLMVLESKAMAAETAI